MSGRRIRLDLSDFVLDIGSHRWMFLSDVKFSTVSDLVDQLKEEYTQLKADDMVQVFMDGDFVIPSWESIEILQSGDLVRVVRTTGKNRKEQEKVTKSSNKSKKVRKAAHTPQDPKTSSSSDSDTNEDITSKVAAAPKQMPDKAGEVKAPNNSKLQKNDDSNSSSDTSESSSDDEQVVNGQKKHKTSFSVKAIAAMRSDNLSTPAVTRTVSKGNVESSSSDSDSSGDDKNVTKTKSQPPPIKSIAGAEPKQQNEATDVAEKPKRKRKRKNKNKNKLAPDQIPIFGPEVVPTEAVINQMRKDQSAGNNHVRFDDHQDESGDMDVVDEEFTAEEIQQLYNQSVTSATAVGPSTCQEQSGNGTNNGEDSSSTTGQNIMKNDEGAEIVCKPHKSVIAKEKYKTAVNAINTDVSCEDVLMKQLDDNKVVNNSVVAKPAPKIVFAPRALSLKEMRRDSPVNKNLKFSNRSQDPDLSQFSALLNSRDAVFNKNGQKVDEASMESKNMVEKKDYSAYHAVSDSGPRVGDVIAFKIVEMGENYAPEVSDFKEGKVLECDGTKTVTFELLKMTKKKKTGKFEIEEDADEEEKVQTFNWAEIIEPRLMFP